MPWRKGNKLKIVREADADGHLREIYADIKQSLGVPHVNIIFQAYAVYPQFLEQHWAAVKPILATQEFFDMSDRLGAEAYTRMHNYFAIPDLCVRMAAQDLSSGARKELTNTVELFHYNNPPLLLLAVGQLQAFEAPTGRARVARPADHPVFADRPSVINEEDASPQIRKVYEDIRRTLGLPFVNTDYRAFARWPDFLCAFWEVLKPIVESPVYHESQTGMRESAWNLARELPVALELSASQLMDRGMSDDDVADVVRITDLFVNALSGLVLNVATAKITLEGGNRRAQKPERAA